MQVLIDPEFRALIPPQTDDESAALETSLLAEGCRDALVIWQGHNILIDGHHRYEICTRHNILFHTVQRAFDSREDVIVWMVQNQLARRNIPQAAKINLGLRMKAAFEAKAKANQIRKPSNSVRQNSDEQIRTDDALAKIANSSRDTVRKVESVMATAPEPIKRQMLNGDMSINRAHKISKALQNTPEIVATVVAQYNIDEPETVEVLKQLHRDHRESFTEVSQTGYLYADEKQRISITEEPSAIKHALMTRAENHRRIATEARKYQRETAPADMPAKDERYTLLTGDLATVLPTLGAGSIDCIITDPPYPQEYIALYGTLAQEAARLLKPGGSLVVMCGQSYFPEVLAQMTPHIRFHWLAAYLTPGGQAVQLWQRKVNTFWKPLLWFVNGDYDDQWIGDVVKSDTNNNDKRFHAWGQSESGMADIVTRFSKAGDLILDPFVGGGTTGLVALALNRRFIGVDVDAACIETTEQRIATWNAK